MSMGKLAAIETRVMRSGRDWPFFLAVLMAFALIGIFNYISHFFALIWAALWVAVLIGLFVTDITRSLGMLLLASCYERPILDFGLGIRGTIKLIDLVIIALLVASVISRLSGQNTNSRRAWDAVSVTLFGVVALSTLSAVGVTVMANSLQVDPKFSIYYAMILVEYFLAFLALKSVRFSEGDVQKALDMFLAALTAVAVVGIFQGVGLLANYYYANEEATTRIMESWAISTLGPNHTHLGTFMALGVVLGIFGLQRKFRVSYILAIIICLGGLGFSHSAVGMGMVGLYLLLLLTTGDLKLKRLSVLPLISVLILGGVYVLGDFGESYTRTAQRLDVFGQNSVFVVRAFLQPLQLLAIASQENPLGLIIGHGFRVPKWGLANFPESGDNNYFAVLMDIGLIGLTLYLLFLSTLIRRLILAKKGAEGLFAKQLAYQGLLWLIVVLIAMFTQEILWPAHSRGATMLVFLAIIELCSRRQYNGESNGGAAMNPQHRSEQRPSGGGILAKRRSPKEMRVLGADKGVKR